MRILDTGEFWYKIEKLINGPVLYRRLPPHKGNAITAWERLDIDTDIGPDQLSLLTKINNFFDCQFQVKRADPRRRIYLDEFYYYRVGWTMDRRTSLQRAKKSDAAMRWEQERKEAKKSLPMDDKTLKALESTLSWVTVYDGYSFSVPLEKELLTTLTKYFEYPFVKG